MMYTNFKTWIWADYPHDVPRAQAMKLNNHI
jgi:hypothetical protein